MPAEIVLPITSPETEWVRGRPLPKMSPKFDHARVQAMFAVLLVPWSSGRGTVGTEWRFRVEPPGEARRPLVPDIAYVAHDRFVGLSREEVQTPAFAPTVAIEVLSPGDLAADVADKIDVYLRSGTELVVVIDPRRRTMSLHDTSRTVRELGGEDVLQHPVLPGFEVAVAGFFAAALDIPGLSSP